MSELTRKLRERVDEIIAPHRTIYGEETPVVKMALMVLAEAEAIAQQMAEERVSTEVAADRTGWSVATLQRVAKAKLAGEPVGGTWKDVQVEKIASGYEFVLGTIPRKLKQSA